MKETWRNESGRQFGNPNISATLLNLYLKNFPDHSILSSKLCHSSASRKDPV